MPPKGTKRRVTRRPADEPAERPAKRPRNTADDDEGGQVDGGKPSGSRDGKEQDLGIRIWLKPHPDAPVQLNPKAQALRDARKTAAGEKDTFRKFPDYGRGKKSKQTADFWATISPQLPEYDRNQNLGYFPLASSMPANRGKRDALLIHRTCAVCGTWFNGGGADGEYVEHMRLHHELAGRTNRHGQPRIPHRSHIAQRPIPAAAWEAIAREDALSRALFAALPGSDAFYVREEVRPVDSREFTAAGDNPLLRGGHPFFPWDMDGLSRANYPPPPAPLPKDVFRISPRYGSALKDVHAQLQAIIEKGIQRNRRGGEGLDVTDTGKGKGKEVERDSSWDKFTLNYQQFMLALERVIDFFVKEIAKWSHDDIRREYTMRNLHLIMYQARIGYETRFAPMPSYPKVVLDARAFLDDLFRNTAPDDPKYIPPTPPGLQEGVKAPPIVIPARQVPPVENTIDMVNDDNVDVDDYEIWDDDEPDTYPAVDVDAFANHMDELHIIRNALTAENIQDTYSTFFESVVDVILPYHEEMNFNADHTENEWANLELARFRELRRLRPGYVQERGAKDSDVVAETNSKEWLRGLFHLIDPVGEDGDGGLDPDDAPGRDQPHHGGANEDNNSQRDAGNKAHDGDDEHDGEDIYGASPKLKASGLDDNNQNNAGNDLPSDDTDRDQPRRGGASRGTTTDGADNHDNNGNHQHNNDPS